MQLQRHATDANDIGDHLLGRRATDPGFRKSLQGLANPYGDGRASRRIVRKLAEVPLSGGLLMKRFHDLAIPEGGI